MGEIYVYCEDSGVNLLRDNRIALYFQILALPGWCFESKSHKTYQTQLWMTKCDIIDLHIHQMCARDGGDGRFISYCKWY